MSDLSMIDVLTSADELKFSEKLIGLSTNSTDYIVLFIEQEDQ